MKLCFEGLVLLVLALKSTKQNKIKQKPFQNQVLLGYIFSGRRDSQKGVVENLKELGTGANIFCRWQSEFV